MESNETDASRISPLSSVCIRVVLHLPIRPRCCSPLRGSTHKDRKLSVRQVLLYFYLLGLFCFMLTIEPAPLPALQPLCFEAAIADLHSL